MERQGETTITCYPQRNEIHFCELKDYEIDKISAGIPWTSADLRLRKTIIFVERFFKRVPCKELADRYGVNENTIASIYKQAAEHVERIITALDARREGLKATKSDKFNIDQKMFLLANIFGFNGAEVAKMFNMDHKVVCMRVKRLADKYQKGFDSLEVKETPIDEPAMPSKLTRSELGSLVEHYTGQGLSHRQAFKHIADRFGEVVGRPVSFRGIESKYYKSIAAGGGEQASRTG
jgi:hypothetical protein